MASGDGQQRSARGVALATLRRIEQRGAFANLVLDGELGRSGLADQDRRFVTQLVYGTTRMRRACDYLIDRFAMREIDPPVRTLLRLGAYQLHYLSTPDHAAVDETVALAPRKVRGFVNAVLRKVATAEVSWPDDATRLSYPDWIVRRLTTDHGESAAIAMLERMNVEPTVHERPDGYVQDPASAWVCELVDVSAGDLVLDLCAAPGGKATLLAAGGAAVIAADRRASRARLVMRNAQRTGSSGVSTVVADGTTGPWRTACFDRVLVDAPCSGLGVLRRRADARWRIDEEGLDRLAALQKDLLRAAASTVRPGGRMVYSVCTVTRSETVEVASALGPDFAAVDVTSLDDRWRAWGDGGGVLLPQDHDTDGMAAFVWQRVGFGDA